MGVLRSLSALQMYQRATRGPIDGRAVVRFLLFDHRFPRSVAGCLAEIRSSILRMPAHTTVLGTVESVDRPCGAAVLRPTTASRSTRRWTSVQVALVPTQRRDARAVRRPLMPSHAGVTAAMSDRSLSDAEQGRAVRSGTDGPRSRREDHRSLRPGRRASRKPTGCSPPKGPATSSTTCPCAPTAGPCRWRRDRGASTPSRSSSTPPSSWRSATRRRQDADAGGDPRRPRTARARCSTDRIIEPADVWASYRYRLAAIGQLAAPRWMTTYSVDVVKDTSGQWHVVQDLTDQPPGRRLHVHGAQRARRGSTAMSSAALPAAPDCVRSIRSPTNSATRSPTSPRPRARASS